MNNPVDTHRKVLEYRYDGVRQNCWNTRCVQVASCSGRGAAYSSRLVGSLTSSFSMSERRISPSCARTSAFSSDSFQVTGQSISVLDPGAAPITSSIHSAGFSSGPQGRAPLRTK